MRKWYIIKMVLVFLYNNLYAIWKFVLELLLISNNLVNVSNLLLQYRFLNLSNS